MKKVFVILLPMILLFGCGDDGASYPTPCGDYMAIRGGKSVETCQRVVAPDNGFVRIQGDKTRGYPFVNVPPGYSWELVSCYPNSLTGPVKFEECVWD